MHHSNVFFHPRHIVWELLLTAACQIDANVLCLHHLIPTWSWALLIALTVFHVNQWRGCYCSRAAHTSVYDKNLDDELRPTVVPDEVIKPQSDKYWAPHPRTGVFGPATEQQLAESSRDGGSVASGGQDPAVDEKAWFRPTSLEDLEKPHHLNW